MTNIPVITTTQTLSNKIKFKSLQEWVAFSRAIKAAKTLTKDDQLWLKLYTPLKAPAPLPPEFYILKIICKELDRRNSK